MIVGQVPDWGVTECPKCGCRRLDVVRIYSKEKARIRIRQCMFCGKRMRTIEKGDQILSESRKPGDSAR